MDADNLFILISVGLLISIGYTLYYSESGENVPEVIAEIGDKIHISEYSFAIDRISLETVYDRNNERIYDRNFVVVYLNITNDGMKPVKIFTEDYKTDFKIIDDKEREYMCQSEYYTVASQLDKRESPHGDGIELLQPGGLYRTPQIFEVPSIKNTGDIQNNKLKLQICKGETYNRQCELIWLF